MTTLWNPTSAFNAVFLAAQSLGWRAERGRLIRSDHAADVYSRDTHDWSFVRIVVDSTPNDYATWNKLARHR